MPRPAVLRSYDHVIYTDASDDLAAMSIVHHSKVREHAQRVTHVLLLTPKPTLAEYQSAIAITVVTDKVDPDAIIVEKEAQALNMAMDKALEDNLVHCLFAVDSQPLYYAVLKGRSGNSAMHGSATKFATLRSHNLHPSIVWIPSEANFSDLPTRP
jgi:hypothetical protein